MKFNLKFNKTIVLLFLAFLSIGFMNLNFTSSNAFPDPYLALEFDGNNDYVTFGDIDTLDTIYAFTIELWFYRYTDQTSTTINGVNNVLIAQAAKLAKDNLEIGTEGSYVEVYLASSEGGDYLQRYDAGIQNNRWYHLALVYNGMYGLTDLYINGENEIQ